MIAFTSWRAVHVCRNRDLFGRIELNLCASFNSLSQSCCFELSLLTLCIRQDPRHQCYQHRNHYPVLKNVQNSSSSQSTCASTTLPPFVVVINPRSRLHWVGLSGSFCNKRWCVGPSRSLVPMSASLSVPSSFHRRTTLSRMASWIHNQRT